MSHKLGQAKHLKHNTYLWQKFWDTRSLCDSYSYSSFQIPKILLLELQPCSFVRLYSYSDAHDLMPKKINYIYSTTYIQQHLYKYHEEILITAVQSTGDLFLKEKSFQTGKKTSWSRFSRAGSGLSGFPITHTEDIIFRLCWVPSC